jgi:putative transposase
VLGVSTNGYYSRWSEPSKPSRSVSTPQLLAMIRSIRQQYDQEYGWPKMHREHKSRGWSVGKERVRKLMQRHCIRARMKKRFKITTDSAHRLPIAPDHLVQLYR